MKSSMFSLTLSLSIGLNWIHFYAQLKLIFQFSSAPGIFNTQILVRFLLLLTADERETEIGNEIFITFSPKNVLQYEKKIPARFRCLHLFHSHCIIIDMGRYEYSTILNSLRRSFYDSHTWCIFFFFKLLRFQIFPIFPFLFLFFTIH